MLRKNIVKQLREVSDVAHSIEECHIGNSVTGERIDFDAAFVSEIICSTLAYASVLVDGRLKAGDPEDHLMTIIRTASQKYVEQL